MKLEPVYLVAPRPKPPSMPTRRAFFGMGLAFVCGGAIGSACGYSVGSARAADASAAKPPVEEELPKSGDPGLDDVRWLAVKAPIEELVKKAIPYLIAVAQQYPQDDIAWRGVGRLSRHVIDHPEASKRRAISGLLVQVIEQSSPAFLAQYSPFVAELRSIK